MPQRLVRYLVCEGPDDLGALRAMVRELDRARDLGGVVEGTKHGRRLVYRSRDLELVMVSAAGAKSGLASRVLDAAEGNARERPDMIGVVYDPDKDPRERDFGFFINDYNRLSQGERRGTELEPAGEDHVVRINRRDVLIVHGAWRSSPGLHFDGLPDEHDLERVMIEGVLEAGLEAALLDWAEGSMTSLEQIAQGHGWKRAFRLWNAALQPKAESFVDKLLEDQRTRSTCLEALTSTPVGPLLERLLVVDGSDGGSP